MTMNLYQMDSSGVYTGATAEIADTDGAPVGWVDVAPPALSTGEVAVWSGSAWVVASSAPYDARRLAAAQSTKIDVLTDAYQAAVQQSVSFTTAGGVTRTFQADTGSQQILLLAATGYNFAGATPGGFYWKSEDNTQVPFTLADLKGLYAVMLTQGNVAFQQLQTLKGQVAAATTIAEVQAIIWP